MLRAFCQKRTLSQSFIRSRDKQSPVFNLLSSDFFEVLRRKIHRRGTRQHQICRNILRPPIRTSGIVV
ncbi:MAG: hypothetical protein VB861_08975, partial [Planctomycetaceae bacterium]